MMNIYHVKLRSGTDLISAGSLHQNFIYLEEPVEVISDMGTLIALPWLQLSKERTAKLPMNMIAVVNEASAEAESYYVQYLRRIMIERAKDSSMDRDLQLAIEESFSAPKH